MPHRTAARAALAAGSAAVLLAACGQEPIHHSASPPAPVSTYVAHGVTVELPTGWYHAEGSLTPHLVDPRETVAIATYPLHYRPTRCAHVAGSALEDLGPGDAFITLQERGRDPGGSWSGFPDRPEHFGAQLGGPSEAADCVPTAHFTDHWFGFSDRLRHFHVEVAFGPQASAATRQEAWAILDHARVDPQVVPDWPSSG